MIIQEARLLLLLEKNKIARFRKIFQEKDWAKIFVFTCFLLIAASLATGTYFFSKNTFSFLKASPDLLDSLVFHLLLNWFFLIFLLTLGSAIVSAVNLLFLQDDDDFLLSTPISHQTIFESRLLSLLAINCWPTVVFGPPLLLALYQTLNLSFFHFLLSLCALSLILLISTLAASIAALKITSLAGRFGKKIINLSALFGLPLLAWWAARTLVPQNFLQSFATLRLHQLQQFLQSLPLNSPFFPSTWIVNFIFYFQTKPEIALFNLQKTSLLLLVLSGLIFWVSKKEYYLDLARARVGHFIAGPHDAPKPLLAQKSFPYFFKGLEGAFLEKDILCLIRNQVEVFQAGFLFFVVLLYFLILANVPLAKIKEPDSPFSFYHLIKVNFLFGAYILDVFCLRFIFPSLSLEGQSAWLIWSSPFKKEKIFQQKLFSGWAFLALLGTFLSFFTTLILKQDSLFFLGQILVYLITALGLTSINLGLGTLLPNFAETNAEKISTTPGGIFATGLSLFYVLSASLILFNQTIHPFSSAFFFFCAITLGISLFFSYVAAPKIEKYEF